MKKYYIVNKFRFVIFVIVVLLVLGVILNMVAASNHNYNIVDYKMISISTGDTLWGIAAEINPGKDIRNVVSDIINMNNWDGVPVIKAGDIISIPVYQ